MTNSKIEQMIRKLVSRFFEKSGDEVVTYDVIYAVRYEKQFDKFTNDERNEIVKEALSRLEGEYAIDLFIEDLREYSDVYQDRFTIPCAV